MRVRIEKNHTVLKTAAGTLKMTLITELRFKHMNTVATKLDRNLMTTH